MSEKVFVSAESLLRDSMELAVRIVRSADVRVHAIDCLVSQPTYEDRLLLIDIDDVFDSGRSLEAVLGELERRCRRNLPGLVRIATAYYKPSRNRTALAPDCFVRRTESWLVFPHEVQGLTREEILTHKPVDPSFFDV